MQIAATYLKHNNINICVTKFFVNMVTPKPPS